MWWLWAMGLGGAAEPGEALLVVYEGQVVFAGAGMQPAVVSLRAGRDGSVAATVSLDGTTDRVRLEALVPPGDWSVVSEFAGEAPSDTTWRDAFGPVMHVHPSGLITCSLICDSDLLVHERVIRLRWPAWGGLVPDSKDDHHGE